MSTFNLMTKTTGGVSPVQEGVRPEKSPAYHNRSGLRHETRDVLKQLNANLQSLEDLTGRLNFMLTELRGVIRR